MIEILINGAQVLLVCMYICMYVCMHARMYVCVYYVCMYACMYEESIPRQPLAGKRDPLAGHLNSP